MKTENARNEYLNEINKILLLAKIQNNGYLSYHMVLNLVKSSKAKFLWITQDIINGSFR